MKTLKLLLIAFLLFTSCSQDEIDVLRPEEGKIELTYFTMGITDSKGLNMPVGNSRSNEAAMYFMKFKKLEGVNSTEGHAYYNDTTGIIMETGEYWLQDFQVLDSLANMIYRMPRAYEGKAFKFTVDHEILNVVDIPVAYLIE